MTELTFRNAVLSDLERIAEIEARCFPVAEAATKEQFQNRLASFANHFVLALDGQTVIGFVNGMVSDFATIEDHMYENATEHNENGRYQSVFGLDVIEEYRHRGIASALMREMIRLAKEEHRKGVVLTCKEHLVGFYEIFGFQNRGVSASTHGDAVWYDMVLLF